MRKYYKSFSKIYDRGVCGEYTQADYRVDSLLDRAQTATITSMVIGFIVLFTGLL
jgi:hypothetical protein